MLEKIFFVNNIVHILSGLLACLAMIFPETHFLMLPLMIIYGLTIPVGAALFSRTRIL